MVSNASSELDEELLEACELLLDARLELDDGSKELLLWICELELILLLLDEITSLVEEDSLFDDVLFELFSLTGKEELDSTIVEEDDFSLKLCSLTLEEIISLVVEELDSITVEDDDLVLWVQAISVATLSKSNNLAFFIV